MAYHCGKDLGQTGAAFMRSGTLGILACAMLVLGGCGRMGDSSLNPFRWFGGGAAPQQSLEPEGGYPPTVRCGRLHCSRVPRAESIAPCDIEIDFRSSTVGCS